MAMDIFLKITGIDGESKDAKHKAEIVVSSFAWGISSPNAATANTTPGKPVFKDLHVTKQFDKSSTKLAQNAASAIHLPEVLLSVRRVGADQNDYLKYKLSDVVITAIDVSGSANGGESTPTESVSFNYGQLEVSYSALDDKGGVTPAGTFKYDVKANKAG
jgi:type VI secretion system secreted protein Hcp